jgi:hypothetical protein
VRTFSTLPSSTADWFFDHSELHFSTNINEDYPEIEYEDGFTDIAGFLLVPLSEDGSDFIVRQSRSSSSPSRQQTNFS